MILLVMGLPGRFAEWCSGALMQLAARSGETVGVAWPPLEAMLACRKLPSILVEIGECLVANDAAQLVVSAHQPDDKLCELLSASKIPFLLALDEPRAAVADIVGDTGAAAASVVRALANSYPCLMPYAGLAGGLVLTADRAAADPAAAVGVIAAHFGIAIGAEAAAALARRLALLGNRHRGGDLPTAAVKLLDGALSPYHRYFRSGSLDEIVWARDLFLRSDGGSPSEPVEATGDARYLVYGPYIQLPPGQWTARVVLGLSPETTGSRFVVDAVAKGAQLAAVAIDPECGGVYAADLDFTIDEASRNGLEIRVMVAGDAIRGWLALGHVVLQRSSEPQQEPIDSAQDFATVLEL